MKFDLGGGETKKVKLEFYYFIKSTKVCRFIKSTRDYFFPLRVNETFVLKIFYIRLKI